VESVPTSASGGFARFRADVVSFRLGAARQRVNPWRSGRVLANWTGFPIGKPPFAAFPTNSAASGGFPVICNVRRLFLDAKFTRNSLGKSLERRRNGIATETQVERQKRGNPTVQRDQNSGASRLVAIFVTSVRVCRHVRLQSLIFAYLKKVFFFTGVCVVCAR